MNVRATGGWDLAREIDPGRIAPRRARRQRTEEVGRRRESEERRARPSSSGRRYDKLPAASDRARVGVTNVTRAHSGPDDSDTLPIVHLHAHLTRANPPVNSRVQFEPGSDQERRAWPAQILSVNQLDAECSSNVRRAFPAERRVEVIQRRAAPTRRTPSRLASPDPSLKYTEPGHNLRRQNQPASDAVRSGPTIYSDGGGGRVEKNFSRLARIRTAATHPSSHPASTPACD
jgi:hypothetical protein